MQLPAVNRERVVQTLVDLVQIDSPPKAETAAVAYVRRALAELGIESSVDAVHNIYAQLPGRGGGGAAAGAQQVADKARQAAPLLINAHVDTVQPTPNIKLQIEHDVLRTDGTTILGADDKAGVAAMLELLRVLQESDLPHVPLDILFTVQEEIGLQGAKAVEFARLRAREGLCLDVGGLPSHLVLAAPGQNSIEATFHGRSAHAGVAPEQGRSAIVAAARAIAGMSLGRLDDETTANIGIIRGGQARNIVPERCELVGEARSRSAEKLARQTDLMAEALRAAAEGSGCRLDLSVHEAYTAFTIDQSAPIVQRCLAAIRSLGKEPTIGATGGGSDANVFNRHGIATVVMGVGYEDIHTPSEHIALATLVDLSQTLLAVVAEPPVS